MNRLSGFLLAVLSVLTFVLVVPSDVARADIIPCPSQGVLGYPTWFEGLKCDETPGSTTVIVNSQTDMLVIVLNIVQWLIITTGYAALFYVITGGLKYITAAGAPDKVKDAKTTVTNAIIGLVVALVAVAIVKTIQAAVSGTLT